MLSAPPQRAFKNDRNGVSCVLTRLTGNKTECLRQLADSQTDDNESHEQVFKLLQRGYVFGKS
jgi:hypothetical protein